MLAEDFVRLAGCTRLRLWSVPVEGRVGVLAGGRAASEAGADGYGWVQCGGLVVRSRGLRFARFRRSRRPVMRPGPRAPRLSAVAMGLLVLALFAAGAGAEGSEQACQESFARVQKAFESRSADSVVGCMAADGTLSISLLGIQGRTDPMKREQALKVLKTYFALVTGPKLKAKEGQAADGLVRTFDYTRRLKQGDPATTRLTITLKRDAAGALRLHSFVESAR
jgi:hypothetical protein